MDGGVSQSRHPDLVVERALEVDSHLVLVGIGLADNREPRAMPALAGCPPLGT